MKENSNRGILIAILICLILIVLGNNSSEYYPEFPNQIETYSNEDHVFPLGDDKIIIHESWGEVTVLEWNEENKTFELVETFNYLDE
ncbi:hypothetical protein [Bacillus sp. JCM 19041]|uniref:hypothetical protein n=1 Tax=Bacillus sp. JCM 19041 TaxID=1460637 RepID=UPI0006D25DCB